MIANLWLAQTAPQPSALQIWVPAVLSAIATALTGWMVYRNSRRANQITERASLSDQQLAWTKQAMIEAQQAKTEARAAVEAADHAERSSKTASAAADAATARADRAEQRMEELTDLTDRLTDWIGKVVRQSHVEGIGNGASPQVLALLDTINGGPPEVSAARLRRKR